VQPRAKFFTRDMSFSLFGKKKAQKAPAVKALADGAKLSKAVQPGGSSKGGAGAWGEVGENRDPWLQLGLNKALCTACTTMGLKKPTLVQEGCIPAIIAGRDVLGCAPTGSGKARPSYRACAVFPIFTFSSSCRRLHLRSPF
jgi:hypothetical protein